MLYKGLRGSAYSLSSNPLGSGGEGKIYEIISQPNLVAKLYTARPSITDEKLYYMVKLSMSMNCEHLAWPQDLLIKDGCMTGFVMRKFSNTRMLSDMLPEKEFDWLKRVCVAINLCDVVREVHNLRQCIGDMNPNNFGINMGNGHVCAFDVDSFHLKSENGQWYPCTVGIAEYYPPELQRLTMSGRSLRELSPESSFTKQSDLFALAVLIFQLLFNGYHPFAARRLSRRDSSVSMPSRAKNILNQSSPWFNPPSGITIPIGAPQLSIVPAYITKLFQQAFFTNDRPDAVCWQQSLNRLLSEINVNKAKWGPKEQPGQSYKDSSRATSPPTKPASAAPKPQPVPKPAPAAPKPRPVPKSASTPANSKAPSQELQAHEWCYLIALLSLPLADKLGLVQPDVFCGLCAIGLFLRWILVEKGKRTINGILLGAFILIDIGSLIDLCDRSIISGQEELVIILLFPLAVTICGLYDRHQYKSQTQRPK